jgi:hypothetical protein
VTKNGHDRAAAPSTASLQPATLTIRSHPTFPLIEHGPVPDPPSFLPVRIERTGV